MRAAAAFLLSLAGLKRVVPSSRPLLVIVGVIKSGGPLGFSMMTLEEEPPRTLDECRAFFKKMQPDSCAGFWT